MPRLNFGKIYIVEHNVKVHTIGKITEDSMQRFHIYAEEQQDVSWVSGFLREQNQQALFSSLPGPRLISTLAEFNQPTTLQL